MTDSDGATERTDDDRATLSRRGVLKGTAAAAGVLGVGTVPHLGRADGHGDGGQQFKIRVENVSTGETLDTPDGSVPVPLSPGAYAVHDRAGVLFEVGEPASDGLEAVAEDGVPTTLAQELSGADGVREADAFATPATDTDPNQPAGGPEPPIFPGGAYEFTVSASPGDSLSLATMFIQSNDLFYAPSPGGIDLFDGGEPVKGTVTDEIGLWDASTEADQQPGTGTDQAPRQSARDTGAADDDSATVQPVAAVNAEGYDYPDPGEVIRVTVQPVDPRPFRVRIENVSTPNTLDTPDESVAVPLSPGAYATHDQSGVLFEAGAPASDGLEAVAEDGVPTTLAQELAADEDVHDSGAFAGEETVADPNQPAGGPEPPIFPGGAYEFTVDALPGDSLSFATMFIQSNDLFYAPSPGGIDLFENGRAVTGEVTDQVALWDASTEVDQQPGTGGDQAPRQSARDTGAPDDNSSTVRPVTEVNAEGYDYPDPSEVIRVVVEPVDAVPFQVSIENVSTPNTLDTPGGPAPVPLSPGAFAVHDQDGVLFEAGEPATPGLEAVAEDGVPTTLAQELRTRPGVRQSEAFTANNTVTDPNQPAGGPEPPVFPGGSYDFVALAYPGDSLSFATMFIQSNDLFYAPSPDGIDLFASGTPIEGDVTDQVALWDASTEADQQPGTGTDQAPRQSARDTGAADDNSSTVRPVTEVNSEGYDYPGPSDVIRVRVSPLTGGFDLDAYDTNDQPGIQSEEVLQAIEEFNSDGDTTPAPDDTTAQDVLRLIEIFNA